MSFPPIDHQLVTELRTKVLNAIEDQGSGLLDAESVHPQDLQKVRDNDLWLWRFLVHQRREVSWAFDMMIECLKWRNEFGVNDIKDSEFPQVFDDIGALYICNKDKQGHRLMIMHVKRYRKEPIIAKLTQRYFVNYMEKLEREDPNHRVSILFDMHGAGLANVDMEYLFFMFSCFKTYYPSAIASIYAYDMPWLFSAMWRVVKTWLNARATEKIKFVNKTNIQEWIDEDQLLAEFGGNNPYSRPTCEPPDPKDYIEVDGQIILKSELEEMTQKKVHFVEMNEKADNNSSSDEVISPAGSSTNSSPENLNNSDGLKTFLKISPSDELSFSIVDNDCTAAMTLISNSSNTIAFKVKTTSPSKYRVRPSVGIIRSGASTRVQISLLHNNSLGKFSSDKFLVVAIKLDDDTFTLEELSTMWQTTPPERRLEQKIRCSAVNIHRPVSHNSLSTTVIPNGPASSLVSKMDTLLVQNVALRKEVISLRKSFHFVLLFQLCLIILLGVLFHYGMIRLPYCDSRKQQIYSCPARPFNNSYMH